MHLFTIFLFLGFFSTQVFATNMTAPPPTSSPIFTPSSLYKEEIVTAIKLDENIKKLYDLDRELKLNMIPQSPPIRGILIVATYPIDPSRLGLPSHIIPFSTAPKFGEDLYGAFGTYNTKTKEISFLAIAKYGIPQEFGPLLWHETLIQSEPNFIMFLGGQRERNKPSVDSRLYRYNKIKEIYELTVTLPNHKEGMDQAISINECDTNGYCGFTVTAIHRDRVQLNKGDLTNLSEVYSWNQGKLEASELTIDDQLIFFSDPVTHEKINADDLSEKTFLKTISLLESPDENTVANSRQMITQKIHILYDKNQSLTESIFHALLASYSLTKDEDIKTDIKEWLLKCVDLNLLILSYAYQKEITSHISKEFLESLPKWEALNDPPRFYLPQTASFIKGEKNFCFVYKDYIAITDNQPNQGPGNTRIYSKPNRTTGNVCDVDTSLFLFSVFNEWAESFAGIYNSYLLIDSGTGNDRAFLVYDIKKKTKVKTISYNDSNGLKFTNGKLIYGRTSAPARRKCKPLTDKDRENNIVNLTHQETTYDFNNELKETTKGKHCERAFGEEVFWSRQDADDHLIKRTFTTAAQRAASNSTITQNANPPLTNAVGGNIPNTPTPKVEIQDIVEGKGAEAINGKTITIRYIGTLKDGTKFDSTVDRKEPFTFTLGAGQVIKGWELGPVGMKVGGRRKITVPPEFGYGANTVGPIPANSTLFYDVELLDIK